MTLPRVKALAAYWAVFPPAHLQLRRLAGALGLKSEQPRETDPVKQAQAASIPVQEGRPDDPMLDLCGF